MYLSYKFYVATVATDRENIMDLIYFTIVIVALVIVALGIIGAFIETKTKQVKGNQLLNLRDKNEFANYGIAKAMAKMHAEEELNQRIKELKDQQTELQRLKKYL